MAPPSTARKVGMLGRFAIEQASRSRWARAAWQAIRTTATHFARVLGQLWLQITGLFFVLFAVVGCAALVRLYRLHADGKGELGARAVTAVVFTLLFGYFGISSFWRARRR